MYGVRMYSSFIDLHVDVQLSQHHLLKRLSFSHFCIFTSFAEESLIIGVWIYFWLFYSVLLIHIYVSVSISQF